MCLCELTDMEKQTNIHNYNHALFRNMMYFMDIVSEINIAAKTIAVIDDKIFSGAGREFEYDYIYNNYFLKKIHSDDLCLVKKYMSFENICGLVKEEVFDVRIYIEDEGYFLHRVVLTPVFDKEKNIQCVYMSTLNIQEEDRRKIAEIQQERQALRDEEFVINQIPKINNASGIDEAVNSMLHDIGEYSAADRAYAFYTNENGVFTNTYEWCKPGILRHSGMTGEISPDSIPNWMREFSKGNAVFFKNIEKCKKAMPEEYVILKKSGVKRIILFPIVIREDFSAFIGLDNPDFSMINPKSKLFTVLGNYIGRVIVDSRYEKQLIDKNETVENAKIYLERVLKSLSCGILQYYRDSHKIVFANKEALSILGYSSVEELQSDDFDGVAQTVVKEDHDRIKKISDNLNGYDTVYTNEYRVVHKNSDKVRYCYGTIQLLENGEEDPIIIRSLIDITDKKNIAELETAKKALEEAYEAANRANSAMTDFLSRMSHDIRTPMNAIIGMTAIAGTHLDDRDRVADCLAKITVSSKHLLGLINEVLDMSKIESGKLELTEEEFNLPEFVDDMIIMCRPQIEEKGLDLNVVIHKMEHEHVIGDSQHIQQAFMNFMSNAIKYTPNGGKINVAITEKATNKPHIGCYEFVFEDNGIGMEEEFVERIFEPFARAYDTRVEKVQGTGLGMPIAKNIVQMMGGKIDVTSKLGVGTRFVVTIYLKLQKKDETMSYDELYNLSVLICDDDQVSCETACEILEELGMRGEWVLSGYEAVDKVEQRHLAEDGYYAVIIDWKMPDMDGLETTRQIRKRVGNDVPIIIISAYDWSDIEDEARAAGANEFIGKPLFKSRMAHLFHELKSKDYTETPEPVFELINGENFNGKKALLVEDNSLNMEIAKEILEMAGLYVETASNGEVALNMFKEQGTGYYDIIFMDIMMPVMNGYEATKTIRAVGSEYAKSIPILAMSANAFAEDVHKSKDSGMNEHIAKPIDIAQLKHALNRWL